MTQAPGHRKWPEHHVREVRDGRRLAVEVAGEVIADSNDVIEVREDGHRARHYFPRANVKMDALQKTSTTTQCPFKGTASYFSIGNDLTDAAWSYEAPYDEHRSLEGRIAFDAVKYPEIELTPSGERNG
jgi:uncharacterized protein (DUF427 family)